MEERCDQFPNCEDFSDEADCQLVVLPDNYVIDYAPFRVDHEDQLVKVPVKIRVNIEFLIFLIINNCSSQMDLNSILQINEVGQKILIQFTLYVSWFDFRLRFYNMKTNINMNTLTQDEKKSIWVPVMVFRKINKS